VRSWIKHRAKQPNESQRKKSKRRKVGVGMNYFWLKGKREGHACACEGGIASLHEFGIIDFLSLSLSLSLSLLVVLLS
jgi:hypothetical protein